MSAEIQAMFDRVAPRYDVANTVFSFGQDRHWRRVTARAVNASKGQRVLDVAAGTGALAAELARDGATVVPLDFSWKMLATGAARLDASKRLLWTNGDGMRLPFATGTFDAVTIAFGLRNLPDPAGGLAELARVTRRGGRLAVLEFSTPTWAPFREVYRRYLVGAIPRVARLLTSDPAAYRYLAESIQAWPDQPALARVVGEHGWSGVRWTDLTGGIVALHTAVRA